MKLPKWLAWVFGISQHDCGHDHDGHEHDHGALDLSDPRLVMFRQRIEKCTHKKKGFKGSMNIRGTKVQLSEEYICSGCLREYLVQFSTVCNSCKEIIFPGMEVGYAGDRAERTLHSFVHYEEYHPRTVLSEPRIWGEGSLLSVQ
jgi:hypothetical protein